VSTSTNSLPSISQDGSIVLFLSAPVSGTPTEAYASHLCYSGQSGCTPSSVEVSVNSSGQAANFNVGLLSLSGAGGIATFASGASNLLSGVSNSKAQIYLGLTSF
jgi:hypothetical protein